MNARSSKTPFTWACLGLGAVATLLLNGCGSKPQGTQASAIPVGTYTVMAQSVNLTTELPGRINAGLSAEVRPQVSGVILKRLFTEGTNVKKGQQLYQIDPAPYQATYDRSEAQLITSRQLALRDKKLLADNAVSQQSVDDANAAYRQAAADVETAKINLAYTKMYSPISGFIGRSSVTEGALVTNDQTTALATVRQLDPIYVDMTETSNDMLRLRREWAEGKLQHAGDNAAAIHLRLDDGTDYAQTGTLAFSEVNVDEGTGTVTMRAVFPNPDNVLLPGMFVHGRLDEGIANGAVIVPQQAVARDTTGAPYVWLVQNGKAMVHRIVTSRAVGNTWLVSSGLKSGDTVVAEGLQNLSNGDTVSTSPADTVHIVLDNGTSDSAASSAAGASQTAAKSPTAATAPATSSEGA